MSAPPSPPRPAAWLLACSNDVTRRWCSAVALERGACAAGVMEAGRLGARFARVFLSFSAAIGLSLDAVVGLFGFLF